MTDRHPDQDGQAWLDALAGRKAGGPDEADARALRAALVPLPPEQAPPAWDALVARADAPPTAAHGPDVESRPLGAAVPGARRPEAANQPQWARRWGWAAALVMGTVLVLTLTRPDGEERLRGVSSDGALGQALWVVPDPAAAARQLAEQLRQAGAQVEVIDEPQGLQLKLTTPADRRDAVNALLQDLDTALDTDGSLQLRVRGR